MTEPVTFGDLLDQARHHLDAAGRIPGRPANELDLLDATRGMHEVITVISQYFGDILTGYPKKPDRRKRVEDRAPESVVQWASAFLQARRAAISAAYYIEPDTVLRPAGAFATERGQHLHTAALALVAGRDLLHMHTVTGPDGKREERSSWAPVIDALVFRQAVAAEIAALARQAAAVGTAFVTAPMIPWDQTTNSRKAMHNASQYLRILHGTIQAAHHQDPVEAADRELVRAVPVRTTPARRQPDGTESITSLCRGVITAAERLRQSARRAAERNFRSPDLNVESLRHAAAASVAATDNCTIMLNALVEAPCIAQSDGTEAELTPAIGAAIRGRDSWLHVAHALGQFTSDTPGHISAEAADAHGLALWTGRLAYAYPLWTPASRAPKEARPAAELAHTPDEAAIVVAATHHATDALQYLAAAHKQQAKLASRGGRLLMPTRSLPPSCRVASRYSPATQYHASQLIAVYEDARTASRHAASAVSVIAEITRAPSKLLTNAEEVGRWSSDNAILGRSYTRPRQPAAYDSPDLPGPVERSLQSLGITSQHRLGQAALIDRAAEQLIIDTCADLQSNRVPADKLFGPSRKPVKSSIIRSAQPDDPEREP